MADKSVIIASNKLREDRPNLEDVCKHLSLKCHEVDSFNALLQTIPNSKNLSLIILDLHLPTEGAIRIIPMLRSMETVKTVPIMVIADSDSAEKALAEAAALGANEFILRPLHPTIVKMRISSCLSEESDHIQADAHHYVVKNLFRLVIHDVSNLFLNFEIFMKAVEKAKDLALVDKKTKRARATLNDIRDLIKNVKTLDAIRSKNLVLELGPVSLKKCLQDIEEIYFDRLEEKGISLSGNWKDSEIEVESEAISLKHQVIGNILTNAIKFSHPGSKIDIDIEEQGNSVKVMIRDYGIGMSAKCVAGLFKEGLNTSRRGTHGEKGTGYGMPLVYQFVQAYHGQVDVESYEAKQNLGKAGTVFIITLKKSKAALTA